LVKNRPTVALFGGSFDPPHKGHQAIVNTVAALDDIDKVIIMPAFLNPFKKATLASASVRLEWCRKVCDDPRVIVSDFETSQGRPVYTIETIEALQEAYRVKYLVIGSDNLAQIEKWHEFDRLNTMLTWLVFTRGEEKPDCHKLKHCKVLSLDMPISSTEIRNGTCLEHVDKCILNEVKDTMIEHKDNHDH
jgi:nicotinate-nucleotide adenylyltransferase